MKENLAILVVLVTLLSGCAATSPFSQAERGTCYSPEEFDRAVVAEKIAFLKNEIANLEAAAPSDPHEVKLAAMMIRQYPTLSEWRSWQARVRPGDTICEFHHAMFGTAYDGPAAWSRRGIALMRGERIIAFITVGREFPADY